jgi:hypothetical protein
MQYLGHVQHLSSPGRNATLAQARRQPQAWLWFWLGSLVHQLRHGPLVLGNDEILGWRQPVDQLFEVGLGLFDALIPS